MADRYDKEFECCHFERREKSWELEGDKISQSYLLRYDKKEILISIRRRRREILSPAAVSFRTKREILFWRIKMIHHNYYVYILANWNNKVLYVGMTNNLERRLYEHKNKMFEGFSKKYNLNKLVYYEMTSEVTAAIIREKEIKKWRREKKEKLIMGLNPEWLDLAVS